MSRNILITGGAGFIGSNYINYHLKKYKEDKIINLDLLTYAGNLDNTTEFSKNSNYTFIHADICDLNKLNDLFESHQITDVIHFAAESHVDNSINGPEAFIQTNIIGTHCLLQTAYRHWSKNNSIETSRFHHISTDEVYGSLDETGLFTEKSQYSPNSPYSASKASSDMLVRSYNQTFKLNTVITNCSNNYGPKQHKEKLIPKVIINILNKKPVPIYGKGTNIRDWLYVEDHCEAIYKVFNEGIPGEVYNIGGDNEYKNIDLVLLICEKIAKLKNVDVNEYISLITYVEDRKGHDYRYAVDITKIKSELGWVPKHEIHKSIENTILYYMKQNDR
ncbi:spore coat protein [Halobacteriovorax sp. BALOs_7]|uniref:dTDP-glucose 4,6-dehydratase n=1 Tax=Halobacteriovorax vibrionivorans TaxID=2152716 RepID=A0ABY0IKQ9_9BACT|nr:MULTISPECIES: dTDP-glucose 4,6-dehydratase [Halobacteriovorax]AYF43048.1 spore coat protein [Halobacteriovorax sp. BALOs_7]RZF23074.1 dTDP-glucose 4,6-dehydratase [Halobacteriovorax vibrionivorans]TGD49294.1 dTDP-glucose 4,6-dehydratase [Halobacteriovorax sp. Y22]